MKSFSSSLAVLAILVCGLAGALLLPGGLAQLARADRAESGDAITPPWLFISLAPQCSSKPGKHAYSVIKRLSGNPNGVIMHFSEVTPEWVAKHQPEFIVLSPQGTPWCRYSGERGVALQNFLWTVPVLAEEMSIPILGICGGHQALALAFGGKVGPIRAGEDDCLPYTRDRQSGVVPLSVTSPDPLFSGTDDPVRIVESHYDEVKVLPRGFVLLASDKESPIQIMRHPTRPVYGIQGHPECFSESRPDGGVLIRNFLKIAALHNRTIRARGLFDVPKLLSLGEIQGSPTP